MNLSPTIENDSSLDNFESIVRHSFPVKLSQVELKAIRSDLLEFFVILSLDETDKIV
jgi:hypothetical protein